MTQTDLERVRKDLTSNPTLRDALARAQAVDGAAAVKLMAEHGYVLSAADIATLGRGTALDVDALDDVAGGLRGKPPNAAHINY